MADDKELADDQTSLSRGTNLEQGAAQLTSELRVLTAVLCGW